ncbi:MAG: hypothetical protein HY579_12800 [Nitrospinae bacterium]|nr:hypothetical protein [Nitrospinota bacterium]
MLDAVLNLHGAHVPMQCRASGRKKVLIFILLQYGQKAMKKMPRSGMAQAALPPGACPAPRADAEAKEIRIDFGPVVFYDSWFSMEELMFSFFRETGLRTWLLPGLSNSGR